MGREREREWDKRILQLCLGCNISSWYWKVFQYFVTWHATERLIPHCDPNMLMLWHRESLDKQKEGEIARSYWENWKNLDKYISFVYIGAVTTYIGKW